jgi:hypothetical protein
MGTGMGLGICMGKDNDKDTETDTDKDIQRSIVGTSVESLIQYPTYVGPNPLKYYFCTIFYGPLIHTLNSFRI